MNIKFNTISQRLFLSLCILFLNIVLITVLATIFINTNRRLDSLSKTVDSQRIQLLKLFKSDLDYLRFAPFDSNFYINENKVAWGNNKKQSSIKDRTRLVGSLVKTNEKLAKKLTSEGIAKSNEILKLDSLLAHYNGAFLIIKEKLKRRGFKDYGLEGKMREFVHQLENKNTVIPTSKVLMLRRYEKDFFLRKEIVYVQNLNKLVDEIFNTSLKKNKTAAELLSNYRKTFNELTLIEEEIGLTPDKGYTKKLANYTLLLSDELENIASLSETKIEDVAQKLFTMVVGIGLLSIVLSIFATYFTSRKLTEPIKRLSLGIRQFDIQNMPFEGDEKESTIHEIKTLQEAFVSLHKTIKNQFEEINQKSSLLENKNEELIRVNEDLDRFIYSAAHDLKSPLTSLLGLINIAEVDLAPKGKDNYFKMMKGSVGKLESFIKDITDYARNKRQNLKIEKVFLENEINEVLGELVFIDNFERIHRHIEIKGELFFTDKTRFGIILKNLVSNAYRYADMNKKTSLIKIKATITTNYLSFVLEDNGIGIGKEHLPKIFDMFYRASEDSKGTGLGLFLVRESVKMLRGNIMVSSTLGEGTTFRLKLPNLYKYNTELPESNPLVAMEA